MLLKLTSNNTKRLRVIKNIILHFGSWWVVAFWGAQLLGDAIWSVETSSDQVFAISSTVNVFVRADLTLAVRFTVTIAKSGLVLAISVRLNGAFEGNTTESSSLLDRWVTGA